MNSTIKRYIVDSRTLFNWLRKWTDGQMLLPISKKKEREHGKNVKKSQTIMKHLPIHWPTQTRWGLNESTLVPRSSMLLSLLGFWMVQQNWCRLPLWMAAPGVITRLLWCIAAECGGSFKGESSGRILSPGYPFPYDNNLRCTWTLEVDSGNTVRYLVNYSRVKEFHRKFIKRRSRFGTNSDVG